jgi:transposase-like protein
MDFHELLREKMRLAIRMTLTTVLEEELAQVIGAGRFERNAGRRDHRNGSYTRNLGTTVGLIEDLTVPRSRKEYQTQVFVRYQRRQLELDLAMGEMFVAGASQKQVGAVMETLVGEKPSASTVSRVFHSLEAEYATWKSRALAPRYLYAFADGTYFSVIYDRQGQKMPILAILGITPSGERDVLAFSVGDRENQAAWEALFEQLKQRGVQQVDLWITDGHQAMINALTAKFPGSARQRCIHHKMQNILGYIPKAQQAAVMPELRSIFYQKTRLEADQQVTAFSLKYASIYPSAVDCLRRDLETTLTFYAFPMQHWRTIRTSNPIERLFEEVKKRSHKMATAFRNEDSCLLLFYAVVRSINFKRISIPVIPPDHVLHTT